MNDDGYKELVKRVRQMLMSIATIVIGLMPIFLTHGRGWDVMQLMAIPSVGGMGVHADR